MVWMNCYSIVSNDRYPKQSLDKAISHQRGISNIQRRFEKYILPGRSVNRRWPMWPNLKATIKNNQKALIPFLLT
jgi:hypothetical protein